MLVRFIPLEDTSSVTFELNNALNISKVIDADGRQVPSSRVGQDMSVKLSLQETLKKGIVAALTFIYDGKLTGNEESPVFGIKFAAIHPEGSYLLYPSRWFPVNDYSTDRFSSEMKVTVPEGYKVVASGTETKEALRTALSTISHPSRQASRSFAAKRRWSPPLDSKHISTSAIPLPWCKLMATKSQRLSRFSPAFTEFLRASA